MTRVRRRWAVVSLAVVLTTACGRAADQTDAPLPTPTTDADDQTATDAGRSPQAPRAGSVPPAQGEPAAGPPRASVTPARANDGGNPGANAPVYLRRTVPGLVVEVDAVEGKAPRPETLTLVHTRLSQVADKPAGIEIRPAQTIPARGGAWSTEALRATEERYRDTHTTNSRASIYLLFVDGRPPKPDALGVTYSASSAAIFADQIADAATLLVSAAAIERAVSVHEVGHLLSLVNLGYTSPRDHEDPAHPGHSRNDASVMFWGVDNVGVVSILGGRTAPPTEFDGDDLADLADIRAGTLP